ncbi:DUF1127 domain-containing protein [Microvirga sp. BT689]|uniref:DUF1127 domain-containing protein n=1 Tax=Microvirga arvi TaxID=2778731 RepID=UPI001950A346|nr:DUF1127 domain-containing protein [Microvirga arvi]MBM6578581.1 DUF1127 domain-containing protein [Microvirga arvi]
MTARSTTCDWTFEQTAAKPSFIRSLFASLRREIEIRRARREVNSLDDAMLHDIGLTPGNMEDTIRCGRH